MTSSPPDPAVPDPALDAEPATEPAARARGPRRATRAADGPVVPDRAGDDLDLGWGEHPVDGRDDDERFLREVPPHWA